MKVAILETIVPSGHEVGFDRGLVAELKAQQHEPCFFVPENFPFKEDYQTKVEFLEGGEAITYKKAGLLKKAYLSYQREKRRVAWFDSAREKAEALGYSCIIIPTATPRYLRSVLRSSLRSAKIPVVVNLQVFSFEKKGRIEQFLKLQKKLERFENIHLTFCSPNHYFKNLKNVEYVNPPFTGPNLIKLSGNYDGHEPLRIGLYGFYRKDLNTSTLFKIFEEGKFTTEFELVMQTVTSNETDRIDCEQIQNKFKDNSRFSFTDAYLSGKTWEEAMDKVDIILVPYASMQFFYTYSAMCFNALGFKKPVMICNTANPHLMEQFNVGLTLDFTDYEKLKNSVEDFINNFKKNYPAILSDIEKASEVFSYKNLVNGLLKYVK